MNLIEHADVSKEVFLVIHYHTISTLGKLGFLADILSEYLCGKSSTITKYGEGSIVLLCIDCRHLTDSLAKLYSKYFRPSIASGSGALFKRYLLYESNC